MIDTLSASSIQKTGFLSGIFILSFAIFKNLRRDFSCLIDVWWSWIDPGFFSFSKLCCRPLPHTPYKKHDIESSWLRRNLAFFEKFCSQPSTHIHTHIHTYTHTYHVVQLIICDFFLMIPLGQKWTLITFDFFLVDLVRLFKHNFYIKSAQILCTSP